MLSEAADSNHAAAAAHLAVLKIAHEPVAIVDERDMSLHGEYLRKVRELAGVGMSQLASCGYS